MQGGRWASSIQHPPLISNSASLGLQGTVAWFGKSFLGRGYAMGAVPNFSLAQLFRSAERL